MTDEHDPIRIRDDENEPVSLRDALAAGRAELPDDDAVARIERRVIGAIAVGGGGGGGGGALAGVPKLALAGSGLGLGVALAVAITWLASLPEVTVPAAPVDASLVAAPDAPTPADAGRDAVAPDAGVVAVHVEPAIEPHPVVRAAEPGVEPAEPVVEPAEPVVEPSVTPPSETAPVPTEASLVLAARRALSATPLEALALAERAAELHPDGALAQEREMVAIEALVALDRTAAARARADRFRARWPGSSHVRRLDVLLP